MDMYPRMPTFGNGYGLDTQTFLGSTFEGKQFTIDMSPNHVGHGATAKIFRGQIRGDEPLVVAVKVLGHMIGEHQEQLLVRELRAAREVAMSHPFIVAFLGTADVGQHKAIVSLYMKNGNLLEYLETNPQADKKKLIMQVAEGVSFLHTFKGLAHGDLKCANVLISDFGEALLADFGLSSFLEETFTRTMTTIRSMNTLPFAAPELLGLSDGDEEAPVASKSRESDVYAFGMLILEAVTGQMPFAGLHSLAVMRRIHSGQLPSRPTVNGFVAISPAWWEVCRACWTFSPSARPRMQDVLQRLAASHLLPSESRTEFDVYLSNKTRARQIYRFRRGDVWNVAYMPCGRRVVTCLGKAIQIQDIATGQSLIIENDPPNYPVAAGISPAGSEVASSTGDYTIQRWNALSGDPLGQPMRGHTNDITCIAYSPDGTRIVSGSEDRTIRLWDASTGKAIGNPLEGHTSWVRSVAFSPDGSRIVSASYDKTLRIWDTGSGEHVATLTGHSDRVASACYLPDGRFVVSGSYDDTVCLWNSTTLQFVRAIRGHCGLVFSVAVSPSGNYIASGSANTIHIWDVETGEHVGDPLNEHTHFVRSVDFSPDGKSLVSGSADGTVRIWDLFE